jgi:dihydropteroate synthase
MIIKRLILKLKDREVQLGDRTLLCGILNVTPDSFSDGGKFTDPERAFDRAVELEEEGADIIDIGAESTRPGSTRVSEAEELRRLVPVLKRLRGKLTVPICVDTYKSAVAGKAIEHGAEIINDPSGLTWDPSLAKVVRDAGCGLVLNHMRGTPETWLKLAPMHDPMGVVVKELEACLHRAVHAGVERTQIILDPGLGFGKRKEQNFELLARLGELVALDLPVMAGPSRKSFLAGVAGEKPSEYATAAAVACAVLSGAHIVRVHDVAAMKHTLMVADGVLRARL